MKKAILFVDDDPQTLRGIKRMLHPKRREWEISFAESGETALPILESKGFDVVVADIRMPGMDGAQLLEKVAEIQPRAIRLILSAYSELKTVMGTAKVAHQFLSKPCDPIQLTHTLEKVLGLASIMTDEKVRSTVSRIDSLPTLPRTYIDIVSELKKTDPSLKRIGEAVEKDVSVSATVLKLVNSSFFGFYKKISSPSQAVTLLGVDILKGLVLGVHLLSEFREDDNLEFSVEGIWNHCLRTGYFSKAIAETEKADKETASDCFIAGLLHDIGKLVLAREFTEDYHKALNLVRDEELSVIEAEKRVFAISHAEVGAYLLGIWGLKEEVVKAVHRHHTLTRENRTVFTPSVAVHVANYLDHHIVNFSDYRPHEPDITWLQETGFQNKMEEWERVCRELHEASQQEHT